ncbi:MAG TPA: type I-C CRISPR-associated protein Cas8c/Csd1 [Deltaproteobacteria bacterium]|nr:type I-C CRISPR-associated protein Cas8c/Csd1 [Deltaproteobacteria bacterium]HOH80843.1 type I-C CRISPR-associated protein Cas8c/Csd1 [Methanoregulaceae archaeon]HPR02631.1 type I-C CRISPR-associated protein Cas8c/Csd1 [Deltaproteobacteria bacterium]
MILQALTEYYHRIVATDGNIAMEGFEKKEIPFLIIIDKNGKFVDIQDTRSGEGKKKIGRQFTVPRAVKKTSGIAANLLWDTPPYVVGRPKPDPKKETQKLLPRAKEQKKAFVHRIKAFSEQLGSDTGVAAVLSFLKQQDWKTLFSHPCWNEIEATGSLVSFQLEGDKCLVCERPSVVHAISHKKKEKEPDSICLITGEPGRPVRLHTAIKGVWNAQTSGANIVSFNLDAFRSYGKEQGENAPVGARAEFAYTTALNHLLKRGSHQRVQVGDASTVFWAEKKHPLEDVFADLFGEPAKEDYTQDHKSMIAAFRAPQLGSRRELDPQTRFYVLGLAPNAARIAVRFWYDGTVEQVVDNIVHHFDDCTIVHGPNQPETLSLFRLLVATALQGKSENIQPNLAGEFFRTILSGTPYPKSLLSSALRRVRAEREITYPRAALIKAVLVREARYYQPDAKEVGMSLDTSNSNIGYRLGRLFAVLEKAQEEANPGINATIRDRFYGAASSTPVAVFSHLMKLKNHHISKLENRGRAINLERIIGEIMSEITDFPAHLTLSDQGRFAVGYYHQRQDFFTKKDNQ